MTKFFRNMVVTLGGALLLAVSAPGAVSVTQSKSSLTEVEKDVRHELVMLPWFGVFDNFEFQVTDGGKHVILMGQVTRPTLRSSAENVVKKIEGVERVTNNIEVLPVSPMDDRMRAVLYRSIFGFSNLGRYAWGPNPDIHIIVKNGHVTLEGVVANETDKNLAGIRANGVSGVFSVTNDLRVDSRS